MAEPTATPETISDEEEEKKMEMPVLNRTRARSTTEDSPELFSNVRSAIARVVDLRVDADRLSVDDRRKLGRLTTKLFDDDLDDGWNFARLSKRDLRTWERLVEDGAAVPNFFETARAMRHLTERAEAAARDIVAPPKRRKVAQTEKPGAVLLPQSLFSQLAASAHTRATFGIVELGFLAMLLFVFENASDESSGRVLTHGAHFESPGSLVIDRHFGLFRPSLDARERVAFEKTLATIESSLNDVIRVDRSGHKWRITLGPVGRAIVERTVV